MHDHLYSKLGLGSNCVDVGTPKFYDHKGDAKGTEKKLGLKKGGHAMDKHSKDCKKMAMGGVGKERLGQTMHGNVSKAKLGDE